ncbi:MAG TPA: alpha/beta hydrolase [Chryseosolibacter sp.]|nr:alpha/beta hydrolase [Chryseosolibacter sp.]
MHVNKRQFGTILATILMINLSTLAAAQRSSGSLDLAHGHFRVGFKKYTKDDNTRSYQRLYDWDNKVLARPISISLWYPAEKVSENSILKVDDYMAILKQEEEWESLPNDRILSWFYYDNEKNRKHFELQTKAYKDAEPVKGKFPVVIYAPSYQASSVENFALCEFLASHGYIVISSPSRGTENRFFEGGTIKDIETQARDIEFLIAEALILINADAGKLSVIGFSFGGISNVLAQMRNERIKALVCLDGSIKYQFQKLLSVGYGDVSKVDVPFMFMAQKDIPLSVMVEDNIDTTLNRSFPFFDSLTRSQAYYYKFNDLTHACFSSMGILFQERDPRQDKSEKEIIDSYRWVSTYVMHFLNGFSKGDKSSLQFLADDPANNGVAPGLITLKAKNPIARSLSFEDFHLLARDKGYEDLVELVNTLKKRSAGIVLQEWKLNNLGLQLLFQGKVREGINILSLNTILYPNSANAFDSLAEGYLIQGNKDLAIKNFDLSLKLDSHNQNAISRLNELKGK